MRVLSPCVRHLRKSMCGEAKWQLALRDGIAGNRKKLFQNAKKSYFLFAIAKKISTFASFKMEDSSIFLSFNLI